MHRSSKNYRCDLVCVCVHNMIIMQEKLSIMGQSAQRLVKKHEVMELHNAMLK